MPYLPLDIVRRWLAAVNAGDADMVVAHSSPEIRIFGPRGSATGHAVLREWMADAGATFTAQQTYARGSAVVVAQRGEWQTDDGERSSADVATRFLVFGGQVMELQRHDALPEALAAAGLTSADVAG